MENYKKKKLIIVGYVPPPFHGVAQLNKIAVDSDILKESFDVKFFDVFRVKTAEERGGLSLKNIVYNILNISRLFVDVFIFKPDIVYLSLAQNTFGFFRDSLFIIIAKLNRSKVCVHFHAGDFDKNYDKKKKLYKKYIKFIFTKIDRLILLAEKFKKQFQGLIIEEKISVLYACCPIQDLEYKFETRESNDHEKKRIFFLGYLSKAKGALDLVRAVPEIILRYREPLEFLLCGNPVDIERNITYIPDPNYGYTKIVNFIKENNLQDVVKLCFHLDFNEKKRFFKDSDIFVFPTFSEGCGLVVLEAMCYGLPVVTTKVGALEEMLKENENSFFIEPGDVNAIANKILDLLSNKSLRLNIGKNNFKLVREKFSKEKYEEGLCEILGKIN
jgi:glycosyltransferase involved in cell wall biosynthesis